MHINYLLPSYPRELQINERQKHNKWSKLRSNIWLLSLIVWVKGSVSGTAIRESDGRFDNLSGSHHYSDDSVKLVHQLRRYPSADG